MNCADTQDLLQGYVDGELDLVRSLEIEQHLQDCAACGRAQQNLQGLRTALSAGTLYYTPPAQLQRRVQTALRQTEPAPALRRRLPWRLLNLSIAVAAVVILAWSLVHNLTAPSADDLLAQEVLAGHVRSLQAAHLADVPSSDQHTVKPWFDGKLDFAPSVEDLASRGFPLVGGRLDYLDNRPVAALIYGRQKHYINLFIWPASAAGDSPTTALTRQGYHLRHWSQVGMNYWAVSDLNNGELEAFVHLIQNGTP